MNQWFGCSFPKLLKSVRWTSLLGRGEDTGMRKALRLTVSDESSHKPHGNAVFQGYKNDPNLSVGPTPAGRNSAVTDLYADRGVGNTGRKGIVIRE